jgi:hypothetical protein
MTTLQQAQPPTQRRPTTYEDRIVDDADGRRYGNIRESR